MGERIELDVVQGTLRLQAVKRRSGARTAPRNPVASLWARVAHAALDFLARCCELQRPAGANQGDTLHIDASRRARIADAVRHRGDAACSVEEIARYYASRVGHVLEIEAQALRKLRHPGGKPLKSVSRR